MAGRTRLFATFIALALSIAACSSDGDDPEAELESADSSMTTTVEPSTTTTEATTTTLSEQAQAEAEVAQIAEAFWTAPIDTSQGLYGLEYTTGVLKLRLEGAIERSEANGQVVINEAGVNPFEVISVDVDLEQGEAEVKACQSSYGVVLDATSGDELFVSDHEFLATIVFHLEQTNEGWKIYEQIGTSESENPERCEIGA